MARRPNALVTLALLLGGDLLFALPPDPVGDRDHDRSAASGLAQNPTPPDKKAPPVGPPAPPKKLDPFRLPADAVIVVTDQATDFLKAIPKYVVLTPEKHQEYLDEIARLRAQLDTRKTALPPSSCRLKGKLEGNLVVLQAQFGFVTETPGAVVHLACSPAFAGAGAQIDGHEPLLKNENGSFTVQVEKPGDHQLTLDLTLPVTPRPEGRGFELDLPRAAITEIDLELPSVKDVRRDGKPLGDPRLVFRDGRLKGGLGPAEKLDLSWKESGATTNVAPVLVAQGKVQVQIDDRETVTHAELTLKVEGGQTNVWRLLVPLGATVEVTKDDLDRVQPRIEQADQKFVSLRTIRFKEPGSEALTVAVIVKGPAPRPGAVVPVGPFAVVGAQRQSGTISVSGSPSNQRLLFTKRGGTEELRLPEDERRPGLYSFRYPSVAVFDKPQTATGPASLSWLDVDAESVHGLLETQVSHALRLARDDKGARVWRLKTTVETRPVRPGADHLDLLLPAGCVYNEGVGPVPAALVRQVETDVPLFAPPLAAGASAAAAWPRFDPDALPRVVRFKFAEQLKPFQLTVEADYPLPAPDAGEAALPLPCPLGTPDRGGQVTVTAADDVELLPSPPGNGALKLEQREPQQQVWRSDRFPEQVRVHWQQHRPHVRATGVADLTFTPREVLVRHRLRFHFAAAAPTQVALRVPDAVAMAVRIVGDGELTPADAANPRLRFAPLRPPVGKDEPATLDLEYSFPLPTGPHSGEPFAVPLIVPDQVAQGDTKVRVWGDLGATPALAPGQVGWGEQNIEAVKDNPRLPALVLLAHAPDAPLALSLDVAKPAGDGTRPVTVLIDRALIRVSVGDAGQSYRASFLLTQLATGDLDVEFPAPVISLNPRVVLDGKEVGRKEVEMEIVDEAGHRADGGRVARLRLSPDLLRRPAVLEVSYLLPAGRAVTGPLQTTLQPPLVRGDTGRVQTRWLVALPSNLVVLAPEGGPGAEPTWGWPGWLPSPRVPVTSSDLESWFAGGAAEAGRADDGEAFVPSLVCTRNAPGPVTVVHAPRQLWLLVCSLVLLACGLGLFLLARPAANGGASARWVLVAVAVLMVLIVAVVVGSFLLPTLMSVVFYGCLPGFAVLVFAFAAHLLLREHHRRQIVFLPSFARGRGGSSIARTGGGPGSGPRPQPSSHPHGEPSTVDIPPPGSGTRPLSDVLRTEEKSGSKNRGA